MSNGFDADAGEQRRGGEDEPDAAPFCDGETGPCSFFGCGIVICAGAEFYAVAVAVAVAVA
ncbi:MAG: hypothetical protein ACREP7_14185, partial [Lysobacter sp.]